MTPKELKNLLRIGLPLLAAAPMCILAAALPKAEVMGPSCHPTNPDTMAAAQPAKAAPSTFVDAPIPTAPDIDVKDSRGTHGEYVKSIVFKNLLIDRMYPSMQGPWKMQPLRMLPPEQSRYVWITNYRAEVVDQKTGDASQEFMCHTNLRLIGAPGAPAQFQPERAQLSISQGQKEVIFPKGFALRVDNIAERRMDVMAMVLNNNYNQIHRNLDFHSTVRFYDDKAASDRKLQPLMQTSAFTDCLTDPQQLHPGESACKPASPPEISNWFDGRPRTGHWMVPPGRQVITMDVTRILNLSYDTTMHYVWMHVHPYAESLELRDDTANKTLWKGYARNPSDPKIAQILSTDAYSGTDGIPLYKDHHYSLITVYNNRSAHEVDAMAALWIYIKDKSS